MIITEELRWRGRWVRWGRIGPGSNGTRSGSNGTRSGSSGTGPAIVMCHGTPWSSAVWERYARALSTHGAVYLWDMPGYGRSSMDPDHDVDLGVQGELFADLLAHWELDRPHVVAHDIGGAVALRAHLLQGIDYASLALVDVVALRPWGSDFFRLVAEHADVFAALPPAIHQGAIEAYIRGAAFRPLAADDLATLTAPWSTTAGRAAFYRQIAQADQRFTDEIESDYPRVSAPTKIIWGREDTWIPVDRAERLAEMLPGAELEIIDNAGHLIQYDAPVELASSLGCWLG